MSRSQALYDQAIMAHNRQPRNFREMPDATHAVEGNNSLCGDRFTVFVKMDGDRIADVSFKGRGCAIAKASASIMTATVLGETAKEARALFLAFHTMVNGDPDAPVDEEELGESVALATVRSFPVRIKCATLPWHILLAALDGKDGVISTE